MKKFGVAATLAAAVAVLAIAAWGSTKASDKVAAPANAGGALVKCGKSRAIGLQAPITGPAASLGQPQLHWAQYYLSTYNKTHKAKYHFVKEDTQLGSANGTAAAVAGAKAL